MTADLKQLQSYLKRHVPTGIVFSQEDQNDNLFTTIRVHHRYENIFIDLPEGAIYLLDSSGNQIGFHFVSFVEITKHSSFETVLIHCLEPIHNQEDIYKVLII